jgi:DNA-binding HxlR family transcriptional regulator
MIFSMRQALCKLGLQQLKISKILDIPSVKILLYIQEEGEVRYTELTKIISSRGALSSNLKALEIEELLKRKVVDSKPIQAYYSLTEKGSDIARNLCQVKFLIKR